MVTAESHKRWRQTLEVTNTFHAGLAGFLQDGRLSARKTFDIWFVNYEFRSQVAYLAICNMLAYWVGSCTFVPAYWECMLWYNDNISDTAIGNYYCFWILTVGWKKIPRWWKWWSRSAPFLFSQFPDCVWHQTSQRWSDSDTPPPQTTYPQHCTALPL